MAVTQQQVAELYVATFNRAPDAAGLTYWVNSGLTIEQIAMSFFDQPETQTTYPAGTSNTSFVASVYMNLFGHQPDAAGLTYWVGQLDSSALSRDVMLLAVANGALGTDASTLDNKTEVGLYFAETMGLNGTYSLANVNQYASSVSAAKSAIFSSNSSNINMTANVENIIGTSGADTIKAKLADNGNTLNSGDYIDGGAGNDTLVATLGSASDFAILAETVSVETAIIQAQSTDANGSSGDTESSAEHVRIDAEDMTSVSHWTNNDSRATLDIEDVRTNSHLTTLEWSNADQGAAVDFNVYFDPQHITSPSSASIGSTLIVKMANVFNIAEGENPIGGFESLAFNVGTETITVDVSALSTYAAVIAAIEAELAANGITTVSVSAMTQTTVVFSDDVAGYLQGQIAGLYTPILLTNSGSGSLVQGPFVTDNTTLNANFYNTMSNTAPVTLPSLTQTDIIFDNLGRGSKTGDFMAGNMSTGGHSGSQGIQQFNITVENNSRLTTVSTTNNALEVINVENGTVNGSLAIEGVTADDGSITTYGIEDVRVFDASEMVGNVTLTAVLSQDITDKYLNLVDDVNSPTSANTNPAEDNSEIDYLNVVDQEFSYDMGTGNDNLTLDISDSNLNDAGTTNREDFVLEVNGGEGNDTLTTAIRADNNAGAQDALADDLDGTANWYLNSKLNANLTVNADAGDDVVTILGAGDYNVTLGTGADTIYVGHDGAEKAVWVLNTADQAVAVAAGVRDINDLHSDTVESYQLYKATMTVTFKGLTGTAVIPVNASYLASDLHINQAIKAAINDDAELSKLLVATDGPANTLVITSLIDGAMVAADMVLAITAPATTELSTAEVAALDAAWSIAGTATAADCVTAMTTSIVTFDTNADYVDNFANTTAGAAIVGADGLLANDSVIEGQTGNDMIVLSTNSTGAASTLTVATDLAGSNNTVDYNAAFGTDVIVNFSADADADAGQISMGADILDFRTLGGDTYTAVAANAVSGTLLFNDLAAVANNTANTSTQTYVLIDMLADTSVANIYQVVDLVDAGAALGVTSTLMGTIDLADVAWNNLTADNFA